MSQVVLFRDLPVHMLDFHLLTNYGCVSDLLNCDYEVHIIANYESSNGYYGFGIQRVDGSMTVCSMGKVHFTCSLRVDTIPVNSWKSSNLMLRLFHVSMVWSWSRWRWWTCWRWWTYRTYSSCHDPDGGGGYTAGGGVPRVYGHGPDSGGVPRVYGLVMVQMAVVDIQDILLSTQLTGLDQFLHSVEVTVPTGGLSTLNDLQIIMLIKGADYAK